MPAPRTGVAQLEQCEHPTPVTAATLGDLKALCVLPRDNLRKVPLSQAASQGKAQRSHTPTVTEFQQSGIGRLKRTEGNAARTKHTGAEPTVSAAVLKGTTSLPQQWLHRVSVVTEAPQTWVSPLLPLTVGSSVARLAEALHVGTLVDTTNSKTETRRGTQGGAVTPDVVPGELITHCGLLGPWVRGHGYGLGTRTRLALGHTCPGGGTEWFQWLKQ